MQTSCPCVLLRLTTLISLTALLAPFATAGQPGQAMIEINGVMSELPGHCMTNDMVLQFWSDGSNGPAQRDLNSDGAYLDTMVHKGMRALRGGAMVQLMSGGEWICKGIAASARREGSRLSFEHSYTRLASKGGGDFAIKVSVTCSG